MAVSRLVAIGVVMIGARVMICAGQLGCRMFDGGMFAGDCTGGMHGAPVGADRQTVAATRHCGTARACGRTATAEAATPTRAATHMAAAAGTTARAPTATSAVVAAPARRRAGR